MADINLSGSVSTTGTSILGHFAVNFAADADHALSVTEYTNNFLALTSTVIGGLTATRNLIAPLVTGQEFTIQNNTTGGQAIVVKGSSGTGVSIPNGATVAVICDGTNYLVPSAGGAPTPGQVFTIRIPVGTATVSSSASIPAGAVVMRAYLNVTTLYSGGATISLGTAANASLFMTIAQNDPQVADLYDSPQDTVNAVVDPLLVTVAGSPGAGVAAACVEYAIPLS